MTTPNYITMPGGDLVVDQGGPIPTDDQIPVGYQRVKGKPSRFEPEDEEVRAEILAHKPGGCKGCR